MKEPQFADVFAAAMQKTLDQDMADLATEMATGRGYNSGKKPTPAFEHVDVFHRQAINQQMKRARQNGKTDLEMSLIQPNDPNKPKVMVVLPNE